MILKVGLGIKSPGLQSLGFGVWGLGFGYLFFFLALGSQELGLWGFVGLTLGHRAWRLRVPTVPTVELQRLGL